MIEDDGVVATALSPCRMEEPIVAIAANRCVDTLAIWLTKN